MIQLNELDEAYVRIRAKIQVGESVCELQGLIKLLVDKGIITFKELDDAAFKFAESGLGSAHVEQMRRSMADYNARMAAKPKVVVEE